MTVASQVTIKELTALLEVEAVNSFCYDYLCKSEVLLKNLRTGTTAPK